MYQLKNDKRHIQILDGGMGRELERIGAPFRQPEWSALSLIDSPEYVGLAHRSFIDAGADIITTNTYAVVPYHIGEERFQSEGRHLIQFAINQAKKAVEGTETKIAGCIPPPFGSYKPDAFNRALLDDILTPLIDEQVSHVDLWLVETVSSLQEAEIIYNRLKDTGKPIWLAFTVEHTDTDDAHPRLRSGESLEKALKAFVSSAEPDAILFNCCRPEDVEPALIVARQVMPNITLGAYPNNFAKLEVLANANYNITAMREDTAPESYAQMAQAWVKAGATIIGGCCGIGPDYIKELCRAFK